MAGDNGRLVSAPTLLAQRARVWYRQTSSACSRSVGVSFFETTHRDEEHLAHHVHQACSPCGLLHDVRSEPLLYQVFLFLY